MNPLAATVGLIIGLLVLAVCLLVDQAFTRWRADRADRRVQQDAQADLYASMNLRLALIEYAKQAHRPGDLQVFSDAPGSNVAVLMHFAHEPARTQFIDHLHNLAATHRTHSHPLESPTE